ncbi:hypothetical protein KC353_g412 [Hortaea werneckii]|nr:hypothetical protein KC353_g412 [Hortaea werneckii]
MNIARALFQRALRLPKAAAASGQQTRHFTVSPPSLRAANHRRRGYTPPSSFPFPAEPLPAWFSKPPKLPHRVETWEIVLVLGLPVVIIGWLQYTQRVWGWEDPEKRVVWQKPEPLELFVRIRRPLFRGARWTTMALTRSSTDTETSRIRTAIPALDPTADLGATSSFEQQRPRAVYQVEESSQEPREPYRQGQK